MAMRINHNIAALNALRNLNESSDELSQSFERLSSGLKVNRAADGPATLVISEQMRGQIASINQAIKNSEASISMLQTSEAALNEVNALLTSMRQLAIHAANEGANDDKMLAADQAEIENALDTIDRIARTSQFGTRTLLDGSNGANGVAVGEGLAFVEAAPETRSSPADGYPVNITRSATRALKTGQRPIEIADLQPDNPANQLGGFRILLSEGGRNVEFSTDNKEDGGIIFETLSNLRKQPDQFDANQVIRNLRQVIAQRLQQKVDNNGLQLDVWIDEQSGLLNVQHREYGSDPSFLVTSSTAGVLAKEANEFEEAVRGRNVEGTIGGKIGVGRGQLLAAAEATDADGLVVQFNSERLLPVRVPKVMADGPSNDVVPNPAVVELDQFPPPVPGARPVSREEDGEFVVYTFAVPADVSKDVEGFVHVTQNSLAFQVGPTRGQQVKISLVDAKSDRLGTGIENESGFRSLREIDVTTPQGAEDAILLVDDAITQVSSVRAMLGAFQKNTLESNATSLRIAEENLTSAESSLRDADMAEEFSKFTRNQIMSSAGIAMLAQANQAPRQVMQLLNSAANG